MTLRLRLAIGVLVVVLVASIAFSLVAYSMVDEALRTEVDRSVRAQGGRVADSVSRKVDGKGKTAHVLFTRSGPRREAFARGVVLAQVLDGRGNVFAQTDAASEMGGLPVDSSVRADDEHGAMRTVRIRHQNYRLYERGIGSKVVQVARPLGELEGFLGHLSFVLIVAGVFAAILTVMFSLWAAKAALRGVSGMTRTTRHIRATGDLTQRVEPGFQDREFVEFSTALNEMLESLEQSQNRERQFVADASHELKTPLTSLRGNALYIVRHECGGFEITDAAAALVRDVDRLVSITDGLTTLARLDAEPMLQIEPVDIDDLIDHALSQSRNLYPDHNFHRLGQVGIRMLDSELMHRIVSNLLTNAGAYSPPGTSILVTLIDEGMDGFRVVVEDDGPGMDNNDFARAFDRFYRGTTSAGTSGTGLGLAIALNAARELGGDVRLGRSDVTGIRCEVMFPAGPTSAVPNTRSSAFSMVE